MTRMKLFIAAVLLMLSGCAFAGGGGGGKSPSPPAPAPLQEPPQSSKAPDTETYRRKNRRAAGEGSTSGTMLTTTDETQAEAGINLGKITLLGS